MKQFSKGDVVRILDDLAKVHSLQENHGGWLDDMALVSDNKSILLVSDIIIFFPFCSHDSPCLSPTVPGTGGSCGNSLPNWRCQSGCQWNDVDV